MSDTVHDRVYMVPNSPTPNAPLAFDPSVCTGCNSCVDVCPTGVIMPSPMDGEPPIILYPEECWYCGGCVEECPNTGAISLVFPASQKISVNWKRRETGEVFRLGMKNPPAPYTRPVSGE